MTYPEHEKLGKIRDTSQAIGEFLEWLSSEKKYWIAKWYKHEDTIGDFTELIPINETRMDLLSEYFEIDQVKLEAEKREMLENMRKMNQVKEE